MFKELKKILNVQLNKMQNFDKDQINTNSEISKRNADFSYDLNKKISTSHSRISEIRKSIQNTKL